MKGAVREGGGDVPENRISRDPNTWGGISVVAGTRIPVFMIVDLHNGGEAIPEILERFPRLSAADIHAALHYDECLVEADRAEHRAAVNRAMARGTSVATPPTAKPETKITRKARTPDTGSEEK